MKQMELSPISVKQIEDEILSLKSKKERKISELNRIIELKEKFFLVRPFIRGAKEQEIETLEQQIQQKRKELTAFKKNENIKETLEESPLIPQNTKETELKTETLDSHTKEEQERVEEIRGIAGILGSKKAADFYKNNELEKTEPGVAKKQEDEEEVIKSYDEVIAEIVEFLKNNKIDQLIVNGRDKYESEEEGLTRWGTDLDATFGAYMLANFSNQELFNDNSVSSVIPKSGPTKNLPEKEGVRVFLDAGMQWIKIEKDGKNTTIYIDHHGKGKRDPTSGTKMVYEIMTKADLLKDELKEKNAPWLKEFVALVDKFDNLSYINDINEKGEKIFNKKYFEKVWPNTLYAVVKYLQINGGDLPEDDGLLKLLNLFKSGEIKDFSKPLTTAELDGGIGNIKTKNGKTIREALLAIKMEVAKTMKAIEIANEYARKSKINLETKSLGKIVYHNFEGIKGRPNIISNDLAFLGTVASGAETFVRWNKKNNDFFINSNNPNLGTISQELENRYPGCVLNQDVRGVFVFGTIPKGMTEKEFFEIISMDVTKSAEKTIVPETEEAVKQETTENKKTNATEKNIVDEKQEKIDLLKKREAELEKRITERNLQIEFLLEQAEALPDEFSTEFIEKTIKNLLGSNENIKSIDKLEVEAKDRKMILTTEISTPGLIGTVYINIEIFLESTEESKSIVVKNYKINADSHQKKVEKKLLPYLKTIPELIKNYIENEQRKKVDKIWIEDGELKVSYIKEIPAQVKKLQGENNFDDAEKLRIITERENLEKEPIASELSSAPKPKTSLASPPEQEPENKKWNLKIPFFKKEREKSEEVKKEEEPKIERKLDTQKVADEINAKIAEEETKNGNLFTPEEKETLAREMFLKAKEDFNKETIESSGRIKQAYLKTVKWWEGVDKKAAGKAAGKALILSGVTIGLGVALGMTPTNFGATALKIGGRGLAAAGLNMGVSSNLAKKFFGKKEPDENKSWWKKELNWGNAASAVGIGLSAILSGGLAVPLIGVGGYAYRRFLNGAFDNKIKKLESENTEESSAKAKNLKYVKSIFGGAGIIAAGLITMEVMHHQAEVDVEHNAEVKHQQEVETKRLEDLEKETAKLKKEILEAYDKKQVEIQESTKIEHNFTEEKVEFSSRGAIQTIENLKTQIHHDYPDISKAPHSVQEFLKTDSAKEAIKLGFFNPNDPNGAESAMILKGSTLEFDQHGNLSFHDIKTGENHILINEQHDAETIEKYHGKMFDSDHSAEVNDQTHINMKGEWIDKENHAIKYDSISNAMHYNEEGYLVDEKGNLIQPLHDESAGKEIIDHKNGTDTSKEVKSEYNDNSKQEEIINYSTNPLHLSKEVLQQVNKTYEDNLETLNNIYTNDHHVPEYLKLPAAETMKIDYDDYLHNENSGDRSVISYIQSVQETTGIPPETRPSFLPPETNIEYLHRVMQIKAQEGVLLEANVLKGGSVMVQEVELSSLTNNKNNLWPQ